MSYIYQWNINVFSLLNFLFLLDVFKFLFFLDQLLKFIRGAFLNKHESGSWLNYLRIPLWLWWFKSDSVFSLLLNFPIFKLFILFRVFSFLFSISFFKCWGWSIYLLRWFLSKYNPEYIWLKVSEIFYFLIFSSLPGYGRIELKTLAVFLLLHDLLVSGWIYLMQNLDLDLIFYYFCFTKNPFETEWAMNFIIYPTDFCSHSWFSLVWRFC